MPTTSPDNIFYEDGTVLYGDATNAAMQATSIQNALNLRQSYNFVWANAAARTSQTGMAPGSTGYQLDTKSSYIYENSAWRLQLPYAEFASASVTVASGGSNAVAAGAFTINTGLSTSTTFAVAGATNYITLTDPGIYSFTTYSVGSAVMGSGIAYTLLGISAVSNTTFADQIGRASFSGDNVSQMTVTYRFPAANGTLYMWHQQNSGSSKTISATLRVARLG